MKTFAIASIALCMVIAAPTAGFSADLYEGGGWPALASDRPAEKVGDILTVIIYENSVASNSSQRRAQKSGKLSGHIAGGSLDKAGELSLNGTYEGGGQTDRSGKIIAQISVVVDQVLPNGDLHVAGEQVLNIDGARTNIRLQGLVRPADIFADNTVLSTRLANVLIDYDGRGFSSRTRGPSVVNRVFHFLRLG